MHHRQAWHHHNQFLPAQATAVYRIYQVLYRLLLIVYNINYYYRDGMVLIIVVLSIKFSTITFNRVDPCRMCHDDA